MQQTEPTAEEIGGVMQEIAQSYKLRRTSDSPNLAVDGLIPGVDAPGTVENGVFTMDAEFAKTPAANFWRDAPAWLILTLEDLERHVASNEAQRANAERMEKLWGAEKRRRQNRTTALVNKYEDLLPQCPNDKQWTTIRGPITRGTYRIQPNRTPHFKLTDRALAHTAGLLVAPTYDLQTGEGMAPLSNSALALLAPQHAWSLPGYTYEPQPPVSYSPAKDVEAAAEPEQW